MTLAADSPAVGPADPALAADTSATPADASVETVRASRMSVDAKGQALGLLAGLAAVFALSWAQNFVVPLLLGIIVSYTMNPLVGGSKRSGFHASPAPSS